MKKTRLCALLIVLSVALSLLCACKADTAKEGDIPITDSEGNTQYAFVSASGRMYMDNKSSDDTGNRLRPYINLVLENGEDYLTVSNRFFVCFRRMYESGVYQVPEVIRCPR